MMEGIAGAPDASGAPNPPRPGRDNTVAPPPRKWAARRHGKFRVSENISRPALAMTPAFAH
jgi:hypothetical protein